jgi:hypothetical protein
LILIRLSADLVPSTQRSSGLGHARVDFSTTSDHVQNTFVSLPDAGILRRFLPRNSGGRSFLLPSMVKVKKYRRHS